jgi:hypothetical protein
VKVKSYRELVSDAIKGLDNLPAPPSHKDHDDCLRQVRNWLRRQGKVNRAIRAKEAYLAKQAVNAEQAALSVPASAEESLHDTRATDQVANTLTT